MLRAAQTRSVSMERNYGDEAFFKCLIFNMTMASLRSRALWVSQ
jgi:hypothetical protein